jgi:hypothetical protein
MEQTLGKTSQKPGFFIKSSHFTFFYFFLTSNVGCRIIRPGRCCFKTSIFETAALGLSEKVGFGPLFPMPVSKPTGIGNRPALY